MLMSKKQKFWLQVLTYGVLVILATYCLFPFLWMADTALKPIQEVRTSHPTFMINNLTFGNFSRVLLESKFVTFFGNSMYVAATTTILSLIISIFAGYALSRFSSYRGVKAVSITMLLSQMVPGVLLLIPLYLLMKNYHLLDTYYSMILAYTTFMVPLCTFMLKGYIDSIPYEMEESAEIDGCSRVGILFRIILPVSIPSLIATALFAFVNAWNEFMFGFVFINDEAHRTLTPGITLFKGLYMTDWGSIMAASVLSVLPVVILFVFMQRFLIDGMTAGAVKG
ncbi:multiple sugar transport system permease protein [Paenibacillus sp. V4I3]|uniref:carbohydrate ABC transporter permease n=1 Tax=Paenibacillus sp. V4I3 TaxID=3042305 RepID=UPI0027886EA0|nr:carbohydrate ABC transporter permease [Paenibacillus sp. V4I3]MDQ0878549.1 multiple sugar transport system permease protein [Paenibacillus sp. V4I3]